MTNLAFQPNKRLQPTVKMLRLLPSAEALRWEKYDFALRARAKSGGNALRFVVSGASIACLLATSAIADSGQIKPAFRGVWTGRIGSLEITACLNDITQGVTYGNYYYHRRLVPINLYGYPDATGKVEAWHESDGRSHPNILHDYDGTWQIEPLSPDRIHGTWSNRSGSKKLPIDLTKVEYATAVTELMTESDSTASAKPCSSDAYHKTIEQTIDTFLGPVRTTNNVKYRFVARGFPGRKKHADYTDRALFIETVELTGNSPSIQSINNDLRERLSPENEANLLACRRGNFDDISAGEEYYVDEISSVSVAAHRLVINVENHGSCGERGVWSGDTYMWNLDTGKKESLFSLFSGVDTTNNRSEGTLPNTLDKFIAARLRRRNDPNRLSWKEIQECYGRYEVGAYRYTLEVAANGITFEIPPVRGGACGESLTLTFRELRPFLNNVGRQFVAELRAAQKSKR